MSGNTPFDPTQFMRGGAPKPEPGEDVTAHKAGRASRGQTFAMRVTLPDCFMAMPYSMIAGHPWMNLDCTRIEIPIQGFLKVGDVWAGGHDHDSILVIHGENMDRIFDHIAAGRWAFSHPGGDGVGDDPIVITRIEVKEMPQ